MTEYSRGDYDPFKDVQPEAKAARDADVPDVVPLTLTERLLAVLEREHGPLPVTGASIRASCRFCKGRGCLNCDTLADAEYKRQFPEGPKLIVTIHTNDPEEVPLLSTLLEGAAAGRTPDEVAAIVEANAARVRTIQERLAEADRESQP